MDKHEKRLRALESAAPPERMPEIDPALAASIPRRADGSVDVEAMSLAQLNAVLRARDDARRSK